MAGITSIYKTFPSATKALRHQENQVTKAYKTHPT